MVGIWRRHNRLAGLAAIVVAACALAAVAVAPAHADVSAPAINGISDQNLGLWSGDYEDVQGNFSMPFDDFFAQTWVGTPASHLRYARFVTAPDAVAQGGECESNLAHWFEYVTQDLHLIPVISVWDVAEGGCANDGRPSTSAYSTDIAALLEYLDTLDPGGGSVGYLEAWDEPNSSSVPAAQAAAYWIAANSDCQTFGCTAIAGGFVDNDPDQGSQAFDPGCDPGLTWTTHLAPYEAQYVAALDGAQPAIWGFHPYYAVNCEQASSVTTFEAGLPAPPPGDAPPQVWFTEVAAWYCVLGHASPRGAPQQDLDANYLVNQLVPQTSASAVFYYELAAPNYTLNCSKYSDSELFEALANPGPLVARQAAYDIYGPDTTLGAITGAPSDVTSTTATFNAAADPGGLYSASYHFDYGPTDAYGSQTPEQPLGPGLAQQQVGAAVSGLTPGTAYHYRLVLADSAGNTFDAGDVTMTPVTISTNVATVTTGTSITVSWAGISNPSNGDWVGIYQPGAPDGAPAGGFYADSCTQVSNGVALASGSCTFTMPQAAGSYEFRLYGAPQSGLLTTSAAVTAVPPPPVENAAPVISGGSSARHAYAGQTLACSNGVWANVPTAYAYQWSLGGVAVAGAAAPAYTVAAGELGAAITCTVTASNAGGTGTGAPSSAVTIGRPPPLSRSLPVISGHARSGARLVESHARWSDEPASFGYRWQRCNARGGSCRTISGAKRAVYTVSSADVGFTIRVVETASNGSGSGLPARSHPTGVVVAGRVRRG